MPNSTSTQRTTQRSLPRALRPFAHRDYAVLVGALVLSIFAHGMWAVAMVYQVRQLGGGPAQLSVVATATSLGLLALVLVGGIAADRVSCRKIVIAVEALSLTIMGTTAVLALTGVLELWHLAVVGFLNGAGAAFFFPAYSALLPRMLPADDLLAANGVEGTVRPVLQNAAGPAFAGMVVATFSPGHAILGIAICHVVAVVGLNFITRNPAYDRHGEDVLAGADVSTAPTTGAIPVVVAGPGGEAAAEARAEEEANRTVAEAHPEQAAAEARAEASSVTDGATTQPPKRQNVLADLREGFIYTLKTPWLLWTLVFAVISVMSFVGPIEVLLPFVISDRLDGDAQLFGFALALFGLGSAAGSILTSSLPLPRRYLTVMIFVWAFGTIPMVAIGFVTEFWMLALVLIAVGVTGAVGNVIWGTLLQRRVPARMLGRVSSLDFFVSLALMPVSMALAGPIGEVVPLWIIFAFAAFVSPVVGVLAWFAGRMYRNELDHPLSRG